MRLVIDRFEGNYVVVVDDYENTYNIDKNLLKGRHEGDIIYIVFDREETINKKEEISNLVDNLFED